jgi:propionyl-CoA carboxylase alpha chain
MFRKILIANRGEIACRIIKTAARLGIKTVAVYSDADAQALHVEMADEAVNIGLPPAAQSYLDVGKIIDACKQSGAEAVHPGYGFLSERASFARDLEMAGIAFIGPNPTAIEAMGDKIESKRAAAAAGVSTIPGHPGVIETEKNAFRAAEGIGYPVMIKASAGGGGKGMRVAQSAAELGDGFARARSEAKSSFGDDRVFLEKFIVNPRHIEIQVLGDKHGNVVHLGERECSIQRRNQKVIEEAPSPFLNPKTRKAMGEQAVALAKAVNYDSAGTVEFIAAQDHSFYFLEMNTRLQVEHPVTELVTRIDLVEHMIRIAAGEPLAIQQKHVKISGWAVECRIYAEDPYRGFLPSTGRLVKYRPPAESRADGATIRIDTGVYEGGEISIYYDPLIAKLCSHGADRKAAITAMAKALDRFHIEGIRHNIPFLSAIMENERWLSGALSTAFIAEEFPAGFHGVLLTRSLKDKLAAVAATVDYIETSRKRKITGQLGSAHIRAEYSRIVKLGEDWIETTVCADETDRLTIVHAGDGGEWKIETSWLPGQPIWEGRLNGESIAVQLQHTLNGYRLSYRGTVVEALVFSPREAELARLMPLKSATNSSKRLLCPMPGLVVSVAVSDGQEVKAGEPLAVVEAMKMENILRAERDVRVKTIHVKKGDSLAVDSVIMEFA